MAKHIYIATALAVLILGVAGFFGYQSLKPTGSLGSVQRTNEYFSTTTAYYAIPGSQLKTGYGSLGSVIITGAGLNQWELYDATTTNKNLRTGQTNTSSILLASIPASMAAGTYTFDVLFFNGLLLEPIGSPQVNPLTTTTITWR